MQALCRIPGADLKERLDWLRARYPNGCDIDARDFEDKITRPTLVYPGQHIYANGQTCFSVFANPRDRIWQMALSDQVYSGVIPALAMSSKSGLHCRGVATRDNMATVQVREGSKLVAALGTWLWPGEYQTAQLELEGATIGCEDGVDVDALVRLVNVTDCSYLDSLKIVGGIPHIGLLFATDAAAGQVPIRNCTIGPSGPVRAAIQASRPLVIQVGPARGYMATVAVEGGTIGHQGENQAAIEITGKAISGGIQVVTVQGVYTEITQPGAVGVKIVDARGFVVEDYHLGSAGPQNGHDAVQIQQTVPFGSCGRVENVQLNVAFDATIRDSVHPEGVPDTIVTGARIEPYYCKGDFA